MTGIFGAVFSHDSHMARSRVATMQAVFLEHSNRRAILRERPGLIFGIAEPGASDAATVDSSAGLVLACGSLIVREGCLTTRDAWLNTLPDRIAEGEAAISDALRMVDGFFGLGAWSAASPFLLLASDALSGVPIYIAATPGMVCFASEAKAVALAVGADEWNGDAFAQFLSAGYVRPPLTYFRRIEQIPPGCAALFDTRSLAVSHIRIPPRAPRSDLAAISYDDAKARFKALLHHAVKARLALYPGKDICVTLSGGLDSRTLAAEAAASGRMHAVTYGAPGSPELRIAASVAERLAVPHRIVAVDGSNWLHGRDRAVWMTDGMTDIRQTHIVHITAGLDPDQLVLDGLGGDFILGRKAIPIAGVDDFDRQLYLRLSRFTYFGPRLEARFAPVLTPLADRDMADLFAALPTHFTAHGRLYRDALGELHGDLFTAIPYLALGRPASPFRPDHRLQALRKWHRRAMAAAVWLGVPSTEQWDTMNYFAWIRRDPFRSLAERLLYGPGAQLRCHVDVPGPSRLFARWPSAANVNAATRHLTLEIFLRQWRARSALGWEEMLAQD